MDIETYIQYLKYCVQENIELIRELGRERRRVDNELQDEIERLEMWISALRSA